MSARDAIAETAHTLHAAREAVNTFAASVQTPVARELLAVVVEHTITALSRLRDQLLAPQTFNTQQQKNQDT